MLMNIEHGLATDIWSLGVIACELLTGKTPKLSRTNPMEGLTVSGFYKGCSFDGFRSQEKSATMLNISWKLP